MKTRNPWLPAVLLATFFASTDAPGRDKIMLRQDSIAATRLPVEGDLPSLEHASTWLNSPPLSAAQLRGKVVLVDFWTYTCINWRRTLPWLRTWAAKYRDQGLVVIGVHTPEFRFEQDLENVRREARSQGVDYPIAIDNQYAIWKAFDNHYWPALYLIDAQGRIRHHQFGEGNYDQLEHVIRQLLVEAGMAPLQPPENIEGAGAEADADWKNLRSPETYLGHGRSQSFASPEIEFLNRARHYTYPDKLRLNQWAFAGSWTMTNEFTRANNAGGRLMIRFHARDVHLVMGPAVPGASVRFRVTLDGQTPGAAHGIDIDDQGNGTVAAQRMYQLIRQPGSIADRTFEIEFFDSGVEVFAFTFG
jgi:thiol-disulfide isomerase/thioredoxin